MRSRLTLRRRSLYRQSAPIWRFDKVSVSNIYILGVSEWEEGLDFALLAINRVLLKNVWKMQKMEQMEETDVLLSDLTDDMAEELGEPPTYPDRPIRY